ncbi:hypothetical protein ACFFV7_30565 [Nonomuraea spiralis]|uniref:Uncharacterized protein n=1 Tax=Nonomuraea spiralis TaxID=46182 RepID=A0ABV5IM12_9ACTN|nr:hypothetical protein [Nonomuraea spiralis]GGT01772.1 hypothetical protein GCM10010176_052350 [Nonomuraea spiralis]
MAPQVVTQHTDLLDLSALSPARLEGLGNSVIALELLELLESGPGDDEVFAAFDNSMPVPHRPGNP